MGPAHWFGFGAAWPAGDLLGDMTGTFGVASRASVRTRQAGQAHARAQPNVNGSSSCAAAPDSAQCEQSDVTRRRAAALGGRDGKGQSRQACRAQRARVSCARARQQEAVDGRAEPNARCAHRRDERPARQRREPGGDRAQALALLNT